MAKLKVIDELPKPAPKKKTLTVKEIAPREIFRFTHGYPPCEEYPRVFYMKLDENSYIQLTGPREGEIYSSTGYAFAGPVKRCHGVLRITGEED